MLPVLQTARDAADLPGLRLAQAPFETLLVPCLDEARRLLGLIEAEERDIAGSNGCAPDADARDPAWRQRAGARP